jgi:hypothetical protein
LPKLCWTRKPSQLWSGSLYPQPWKSGAWRPGDTEVIRRYFNA